MIQQRRMRLVTRLVALVIAGSLTLGMILLGGVPAAAQDKTLTNLAHLDFLLDEVTPPRVKGHTTYRLDTEPQLLVPWTYADARPGGAFERVGGGQLDPETGDYAQGAFNTDDIARAAVVYLRHWQQTGNKQSKTKAYELLRSVAYLQTATGKNKGNSVLWMQPDGELNPSAEPVELPDPSDSGPSYWQARTVWAFGEGYAAFKRTDPTFATFLRQRLRLSVAAIDRQVLDAYGDYVVSDGKRLPGWLIVNGADATAEAVIGLSAYVEVQPKDRRVRTALAKLSRGIAEMSAGDAQSWPYSAILPWAESRSLWHAWSSQMSVALARSSEVLDRPRLLRPALRESVSFDTTLLTAGGPDNAWLPTPIDRTQIAYGADSRVQSLLAVSNAAKSRGVEELAGMAASWFFGSNRSGAPVYDPHTGVTYDGVAPDGTVNRNSGAESTIHGLLTMLALDDHPRVRARAQGVANVVSLDGLTVIEGESATKTNGTVVTPESAWTGESEYGGGKYLRLDRGEYARFGLGSTPQTRLVEPVSFLAERGRAVSLWRQQRDVVGLLRHRVGDQGITAVSGALLPQQLWRPAESGELRVRALRGPVKLDAVIVRPVVSRVALSGPLGTTELVHSASRHTERVQVGIPGATATVRSYDVSGRLTSQRRITGEATVSLPAGGFAVTTS